MGRDFDMKSYYGSGVTEWELKLKSGIRYVMQEWMQEYFHMSSAVLMAKTVSIMLIWYPDTQVCPKAMICSMKPDVVFIFSKSNEPHSRGE